MVQKNDGKEKTTKKVVVVGPPIKRKD